MINKKTVLTGMLLSAITFAHAADVTGRPTRVMPLGDSLTQAGGYRPTLRTLVYNGNKTLDFVGHNVREQPEDGEQSGDGGWRADQLAGFAPPPSFESPSIGDVSDWIPLYKPDIILLMAGTNDWLQNKPAGTNVINLIDECFSLRPSVRIIVGLIPRDRADRTNMVDDNNQIKAHVNSLKSGGAKIEWVDTYSALTAPGDFQDGVHPNQGGYDKLATVFHNALKGYLNNTSYIKQTGTVIGANINDTSKPYSNAFDGNTSTSASLKKSGWVGLDLGSAKRIHNIRVRHASSYDRKLLIQASNSSTFSSGVTTIKSISKANGGKWEQRTIQNTSTFRYVRVKPNDNNGIGIREFEIFSTSGSGGGSGGSSSSSSSSGGAW